MLSDFATIKKVPVDLNHKAFVEHLFTKFYQRISRNIHYLLIENAAALFCYIY